MQTNAIYDLMPKLPENFCWAYEMPFHQPTEPSPGVTRVKLYAIDSRTEDGLPDDMRELFAIDVDPSLADDIVANVTADEAAARLIALVTNHPQWVGSLLAGLARAKPPLTTPEDVARLRAGLVKPKTTVVAPITNKVLSDNVGWVMDIDNDITRVWLLASDLMSRPRVKVVQNPVSVIGRDEI